ncbi:MAG: GPR endopeptidase [Bacillaceae bacterium]|nr:GPR endopeptidase [Bacillaceae bacterium]
MSEQHGKLDLSRYQVRTDLALEAHQMMTEKRGGEIPGVEIQSDEQDGIRTTWMHVKTKEGGEEIGKLPGHYLTLEAPGLRRKDTPFQDKVTTRLAQNFDQFLKKKGIGSDARALVIGLGNWNVTPDALGPIVVENVLITRHLYQLMPDEVDEGYRSVSALAPGVLGITGIETGEIVHGVIGKVQPDFIIAVDALASRAIERVNTTIQITDTGIHPGSGIGNKRMPITEEVLGVPVIAIGVPTVVDATTIASDTIEYILAHLGRQMKANQKPPAPAGRLAPEGASLPEKREPYTADDLPTPEEQKVIMGLVGNLKDEEKRELIREVLQPLGHNLIVTPKEVDQFIEDMGNILANGLNAALHEVVDMENVSAYTH